MDAKHIEEYKLGQMAIDNGEYEAAVKHFKLAIHLNSQYHYSHHGLGYAYTLLKQYSEAIEVFETATELQSGSDYPYLGLGENYFYLERYEEAKAAYFKAIALKPQNPKSYHQLGRVYYKVFDYKEALRQFTLAVQLNNQEPLSHDGVGSCYLKLGLFSEAIEFFEKAIQLDKSYARPFNGLGKAYFELANYPQALSSLFRAFYLEPKDYWTIFKVLDNCGEIRPAFIYQFIQHFSYKRIREHAGLIVKHLKYWSGLAKYIEYIRALNMDTHGALIPQIYFMGGDPVSTVLHFTENSTTSPESAYFYLVALDSFELENELEETRHLFQEIATEFVKKADRVDDCKSVFYCALIQLENTNEKLALESLELISEFFPFAKLLEKLIIDRELDLENAFPEFNAPYYLQCEEKDFEKIQLLAYLKVLERTAIFLGISLDNPRCEIWELLLLDRKVYNRIQIKIYSEEWKKTISNQHYNLSSDDREVLRTYLDNSSYRLLAFLEDLDATTSAAKVEEKIGASIQDLDFNGFYFHLIYDKFINRELDQNQVFRLVFYSVFVLSKYKGGQASWKALKNIVGASLLIPSMLPDFGYSPLFGILGIASFVSDDLSNKLQSIFYYKVAGRKNESDNTSIIPYKVFCSQLEQCVNDLADKHGSDVFRKKYNLPQLLDCF